VSDERPPHHRLDDDLLQAVAEGDVDAVARLIDGGASPNAATESGWSALSVAIESDHVEVVTLLVLRGADVNARTAGWTALHHAVDAEADFHHQAGTPLDLGMIGPLLSAGADPSLPSDWNGQTALDIARDYRYERAVRALEAAASSADEQGRPRES
jgi:ankyrin repeat protein